jgi:hypothetical protein
MFPRNDTALRAYIAGLDKVIQDHAAELAAKAVRGKVRAITNYFRRVGRAALMNEVTRADFDRVQWAAKKKTVAPPTPAANQEKSGKQ